MVGKTRGDDGRDVYKPMQDLSSTRGEKLTPGTSHISSRTSRAVREPDVSSISTARAKVGLSCTATSNAGLTASCASVAAGSETSRGSKPHFVIATVNISPSKG